MNYNNKKFRVVQNTENGETSEETIFEYKQKDTILTCEYKGGKIVKGHLIGLVDKDGNIEMRYHQVNLKGELMTGICSSKPKMESNGKIRLYEEWQWTSGDQTSGKSVLEEV
ncbi:n-acetylglutamate synthase [Polaribacter atrinae]|nr:n-acetylglutamate synthase [Polaribacter atrinae]